MDELLKGLAPALAAGLGIQRFLKVIDAFFSGLPKLGDRKKWVMAFASLALAATIARFGCIRILVHLPSSGQSAATSASPKGTGSPVPDSVDLIVAILFISGGIEGLNALLKFLNYKKEESKGNAANALANTEGKKIKGADALSAVRGS